MTEIDISMHLGNMQHGGTMYIILLYDSNTK